MEEITKISFDDDFKVRGFDSERFNKSDLLSKESKYFSESITTLKDKSNSVVEALKIHTKKIDHQKLKVNLIIIYYSLV